MKIDLRQIPTKGSDDAPNGYVVPVWHADEGPAIGQVYVTAIAPGCMKGPHLHFLREGRFTCVSGEAVIVTRKDGKYERYDIGGRHGFSTVVVPVGTAAALYNLGSVDAVLLNMPFPGWRASEPDEQPVDGWEYRP